MSFKKGDKIMGLSFQLMAWERDGLPKPMLVAGKIIKSVKKPHLGLSHLVKLVPGLIAPFPLTKSGKWWIRDNDARLYISAQFKRGLILWKKYLELDKKKSEVHVKLSQEIY